MIELLLHHLEAIHRWEVMILGQALDTEVLFLPEERVICHLDLL